MGDMADYILDQFVFNPDPEYTDEDLELMSGDWFNPTDDIPMPDWLAELNPEMYLDPDRPYLVLDFETDTSHGDFGAAIHPKNQMLLACWEIWHHGKMLKQRSTWGGEYNHSELIDDIEFVTTSSLHPNGFVVAHNAKYELMWLHRMGLDLYQTPVYDTQIGEYVLLGNLAAGDEMMRPRPVSLQACCIRRGLPMKDPAVDRLMHDGINPVEHPPTWLQGRCKQDVSTTQQVFQLQLQELKRSNRLPVALTRMLLTQVLAHSEFNGMALDKDEVDREFQEHMKLFNQLNQEMDDLTGGINWRSTKQVATFIYDDLGFKELRNRDGSVRRTKPSKRCPNGNKLTDQKSLEQLVATTAKQRRFLELRKELGKVNAAITKNLKFFQGVCKEQDGVFHAQFHQTKTATHRLSSSGVKAYFECFDEEKTAQFQNLPRKFKPLFTTKRKGWLMCEADGSQLEFRVAAHLGRDVQAQADIISGHDVHRFTASVLNGVTEDEVTKDQRQNAKPDTFKPLYGGQSGTKEQQAYYKAFRERYPDIDETQKRWISDVVIDKRLITEWGMRYYWPYAKVNKGGYCNVTTSVSNYPVQAFATAEIIPIALIFFWHRVRCAGLQDYIVIVNTIHDSVICEVHPEYFEDWKEIAILSFTTDVYEYLQRVYGVEFNWVPLGVGMGWGSHWSAKDNEELEMNVYHDGRREIK